MSPEKAYEELPSRWEMITNKDGKFIRYAPCDAEIEWVEIDKKNNKMYVNFGQDGETNNILSWSYSEKPFKDGKEHYFYFKIKGEYLNETMVTLNYNITGGVSSWIGLDGGREPVLYIPDVYSGNYPYIKQPCRECFSEAECNEK